MKSLIKKEDGIFKKLLILFILGIIVGFIRGFIRGFEEGFLESQAQIYENQGIENNSLLFYIISKGYLNIISIIISGIAAIFIMYKQCKLFKRIFENYKYFSEINKEKIEKDKKLFEIKKDYILQITCIIVYVILLIIVICSHITPIISENFSNKILISRDVSYFLLIILQKIKTKKINTFAKD